MEIIYAEDDEFLRALFSMKMKVMCGLDIIECGSGNDVIEILKQGSNYPLIISDFNMQDGTGADIYKYMKTNRLNIPFVSFSSEDLNNHPVFDTFLDDHIANDQLDKPPEFGTLSSVISKALDLYDKEKPTASIMDSEYVSTKIKIIYKLKYTPVDLYIKLSKVKYLKVMHAHSKIDEAFISKYKNKEVSKLFMKNKDFEPFTNFCINALLKKMLTLEVNTLTERYSVQLDVFEVVQTHLLTVGMSESIISLTKKSVEDSLNLIEKVHNLKDLIIDLKRGQNFIYEHSLLVAYVACGMLEYLPLGNSETKEKLSIAAFLHDITVLNHTVAIEYSKTEGTPSTLSRNEIAKFENHPIEAAQLIQKTEGLPDNIDKIVAQHHELPLGKGFPRKLTSNNITPLSIVFIVAHKYVDLLYMNDFDPSLFDDIYSRMNQIFKSGNFKKSLDALYQMVSK